MQCRRQHTVAEPAEAKPLRYASVCYPSRAGADCSHGPFCPRCHQRLIRHVLPSCICRALITGWDRNDITMAAVSEADSVAEPASGPAPSAIVEAAACAGVCAKVASDVVPAIAEGAISDVSRGNVLASNAGAVAGVAAGGAELCARDATADGSTDAPSTSAAAEPCRKRLEATASCGANLTTARAAPRAPSVGSEGGQPRYKRPRLGETTRRHTSLAWPPRRRLDRMRYYASLARCA